MKVRMDDDGQVANRYKTTGDLGQPNIVCLVSWCLVARIASWTYDGNLHWFECSYRPIAYHPDDGAT